MKILLSILFALCLAYFMLDKQLYFHGKNDLNIYKSLPIDTHPEFWGHNRGDLGFVLADEFHFTIVAKGTKYSGSPFVVDEIVKYGYDKSQVIVIASDSIGNNHVLECNQEGDKINILVDSIDISSVLDQEGLSWINIKEDSNYIIKVELVRNYIQIIFIILFLFTINKMTKLKRFY